MSAGPENRFIASVHRLLKGKCHFEKMHNPYRGGTADVWYSGPSGDLWVEYKWLSKLPKKIIIPNLSDLQREWLRGRYAEGRNVAVIVGMPAGGILFLSPMTWGKGRIASQDKLMPKKEIADWISEQVGTTSEKPIENRKEHNRRPNRDVVVVQDRSNIIHAVRVNKVHNQEEK